MDRQSVSHLIPALSRENQMQTKKYHLHHPKVYSPRTDRITIDKFPRKDLYELQPEALPAAIATTSFSIDKLAMGMAGRPGSRFLDLNKPQKF
jgi:hypothetical protein